MEIVKDFMLFLQDTLLETGEIILPQKCGTIRIIGHKTYIRYDENGNLKNRIDYNATRKLWEKDLEAKLKKQYVYHLNEHSNGYYYTFTWSKNKVPLRNKNNYEFKACRKLTRRMSQAVTNQKEYLKS